jgi:hypothetical protein
VKACELGLSVVNDCENNKDHAKYHPVSLVLKPFEQLGSLHIAREEFSFDEHRISLRSREQTKEIEYPSFSVRFPDSIRLQARSKECSKFGRGSILHTFCLGESGNGAAEYHAREIAGTGISWMMLILMSVQIPNIWYPRTDRAVCQKWATGASPEEAPLICAPQIPLGLPCLFATS